MNATELRIFRANAQDVGGCNTCVRRPFRVWVISSGRGAEWRMCNECIKELHKATGRRTD